MYAEKSAAREGFSSYAPPGHVAYREPPVTPYYVGQERPRLYDGSYIMRQPSQQQIRSPPAPVYVNPQMPTSWTRAMVAYTIMSTFAFVFHAVGFATPAWISAYYSGITLQVGLWQYCLGDTCGSIFNSSNEGTWTKYIDSSVMLPSRVLASLALIVYADNLIMAFCYIYCDTMKRVCCCAGFLIFYSLLAALLGLASVITWAIPASLLGTMFGYSAALVICAACVCLIGGCICACIEVNNVTTGIQPIKPYY